MTTQPEITQSPFGRVVLVGRTAQRSPADEQFSANLADALVALIPSVDRRHADLVRRGDPERSQRRV